jgi:hypothetical protein
MFAARTFSRLGGSLSRTATVNNVATKFRVALPTIRFMSEMAETPEGEEVRPPQVYVGNLPFALDEDQLKAMVADKIGDRSVSVCQWTEIFPVSRLNVHKSVFTVMT